MTVHFKGKCLSAKNVICNVPCESKWNKEQPLLVMRGMATDLIIEDELITIN